MRYLYIIVFSLISLNAIAFQNFYEEADKISINIGCLNPVYIGGSGSRPMLYKCEGGKAGVVSVYINSEADRQSVKNIKFIWNDWTKDAGYGLHADASIATAWAAALANIYAPLQVEEVLNAFASKKTRIISNGEFELEYTYRQGPAMDERMIVITSK